MAQKRTAARHAFEGFGFLRIPRTLWTGRIRGCPGTYGDGVSIGAVPVAAPLPHIAGHVEQAVAIRGKCCHRRSVDEAIRCGISIRKTTLPDIGEFRVRVGQ